MIPNADKNVTVGILFTAMLETTKEKAYQYHNLAEPCDYQLSKRNLNSGLKSEPDYNLQIQQGDQLPILDHTNKQPQIVQQKIQQRNYVAEKHKDDRFSPFLPKCQNPFDRNANSKTLNHKFDKLTLDQRKSNIAALVEESRKPAESRNYFQYGRSAPKKSTQSVDINDILRYTLGIKKDKQKGVTPTPLKNPFVRVPPKYSDTCSNFYKGFQS